MIDRITDPIEPNSTYSSTLTESALWSHFQPRPGDVVVTTPPKSGTTWMQGILALLISGDPMVDANPSERSPWFDNKMADIEEKVERLASQSGQRHVKTHTPVDGIPIWKELRYITVYRHPIDVHFSARKHVANYSPEVAEAFGLDDKMYPPDPRDSFRIFLGDGDVEHGSLKGIVNHFLQTLQVEPRENFLRVHYSDMKRDLAAHMELVAKHIGVSHAPDVMASLVDAASFRNMKANADRFALVAGEGFWRSDAGIVRLNRSDSMSLA